jgi:hypothetical protein
MWLNSGLNLSCGSVVEKVDYMVLYYQEVESKPSCGSVVGKNLLAGVYRSPLMSHGIYLLFHCYSLTGIIFL